MKKTLKRFTLVFGLCALIGQIAVAEAKAAAFNIKEAVHTYFVKYAAATGLVLFATVFSNTGKAITTNRLKGSGTEPVYVAWGTGAGTAGQTDTTLFTESAEARTAGASSQVTTSTTNDTYQVVGTIVATAGRTITNAGLFDASTTGNIFMKGDFTGVVLANGESIQFTMQVQYT